LDLSKCQIAKNISSEFHWHRNPILTSLNISELRRGEGIQAGTNQLKLKHENNQEEGNIDEFNEQLGQNVGRLMTQK
jgi:hypothetical protein